MKRYNGEKLLRVGGAVSVPALAAVIQSIFWTTIQPFIWFFFYPAVFFASWIGGLSGGLIATVLSIVIVKWLFVPPLYSLEFQNPTTLYSMVVFAFMGILFSVVHEQLKQATKRASEQRFRSTLDSMLEGCQIIDREWRYVYVNEAAATHGQSTRETLIGKTMMEAYPGIEKTPLFDILRRCQEKHSSDRMENKFDLPDGGVGYFELSIQPVPEGIFVLSMDVTERKRAEEALQASEEKYRLIADNADDWVYWISPDGRIRYISPSCQRLTGYTTAEFSDDPKLIEAIAHPEDKESVEHHTAKIHEQSQCDQLEFRIISKSGELHWIDHSCAPIYDHEGKYAGRRGTNREITGRKLAEEKIKTLNAELESRVVERTAQLAAANKELEAFSYSVSHDLRAPLRHASGFVDLLVKRFEAELPEKARHYLTTIAESVHQMGMLVDDLLQFSRTGRTEMRRSNSDMNAIVKEVLESLRHDTVGRTIEWILPNLPPAFCDGAMLKLVWTNLLSNAVKFSRTRQNARIEIGIRQEKTESVFFVRDNGVGFDMQYSQKLFGVFQRLHSTEEFEGTGIGLANVRRIISRHEGRTWAEAELDKGATFYFTLPSHKDEKP